MATYKQTVQVTTRNADGTTTHSSFEMDADTDDLMTDAEIKDFWCHCPPLPGGEYRETIFHDDDWLTDPETGEEYFSKHHYTCRDCGKTTQIG